MIYRHFAAPRVDATRWKHESQHDVTFCQGLEAPPLTPSLFLNETRLRTPHQTFSPPSIYQITPCSTNLFLPNPTVNMVAQTAAFKKAVEDSRKLQAKPSDDELLQVREQWLQVNERHTRLIQWYSSTDCSSRVPRTLLSSPLTSPACSTSR